MSWKDDPPGCDFCSKAEHPRWLYPAEDFIMGFDSKGDEHVSEGGWLACSDCSELIELEAWEGLADRVAMKVVEATATPDPVRRHYDVKELIRPLHAKFREHRTGERRPFG